MLELVNLFKEQEDIDTKLFLMFAMNPSRDYTRLLGEFASSIHLYRFVADQYKSDFATIESVSFECLTTQTAMFAATLTGSDAFHHASNYFSGDLVTALDASMSDLNGSTNFCQQVISRVRRDVHEFGS